MRGSVEFRKGNAYFGRCLFGKFCYEILTLSFLFSLLSTAASIGVLYLSARVGKIFRNKFTIAIGSAIVRAQTFGRVSIAKKPMGSESLCVTIPLLHSIMNFSIYSGSSGFLSFFLLNPPRPPSSHTLSFHSLTFSFL